MAGCLRTWLAVLAANGLGKPMLAPTSYHLLIDGLRRVDVGGPGQWPVTARISTDDLRVLAGSNRETVYPPNPTCETCL